MICQLSSAMTMRCSASFNNALINTVSPRSNEKDIPYYKTPPIDDQFLTPEDMVKKGKLHDVCSRIVLEILWLTRRARPDTYWAVNSLARLVSKWTVACDKRLLRLVGYLRWSKYHSLQVTVGNMPKECVIM